MSAVMEATPATPDEQPAEELTGTPQGEPAEQPATEEPADQPQAEPETFGQAEYTRSQQAFSALRTELGLDRRATREDVLEAVRARAQEADEDEDEEADVEVDPRITEAEQRAFAAELRVAQAVYGDTFTTDALELTNLLRTNDDPNEIMVAIAAFRDKHSIAPVAAPIEDERPGAPRVPAPVGLSEGDSGPSARQAITASAGRRESGAQQAIRGIFGELGIGSRTTTKP